jgi:hypothetical protein
MSSSPPIPRRVSAPGWLVSFWTEAIINYNQKAYDAGGSVTLHDYFTAGMVFNHSPTFQVNVTGQFIFYNLALQGYLISSN